MCSVELPGIRVVEIVSEARGQLLSGIAQASPNLFCCAESLLDESLGENWSSHFEQQVDFAHFLQTESGSAKQYSHSDILPAAFEMERAQPHRGLYRFCARPVNDGGQPSPTCVFLLGFFPFRFEEPACVSFVHDISRFFHCRPPSCFTGIM
jgi:hypothetical protein